MKFLMTNQETERLKFRNLESSDFDTWLELFQDPVTNRMIAMDDYKTPKECCEKWFEATLNRYEKDLGGQNVLICKETNEIIGQCGLLVREIENETEIEIAYSILPKHRMKGYAFESARKCRDFAFENDFHERLISIIMPDNLKSKSVAIKNGMKFNRQVDYQGRVTDLFQILKSEWEIIK
jgi:RimJ/RimL family protein N-acetyltransferase